MVHNTWNISINDFYWSISNLVMQLEKEIVCLIEQEIDGEEVVSAIQEFSCY